MNKLYKDLGRFSGLVDASKTHSRRQSVPPGAESAARIRAALSFDPRPAAPLEIRTERVWEHAGVTGEEISWSVGYGPRTHVWMLRPSGVTRRLPGVCALCCHSGFYYFGKEKIADGPDGPHVAVSDLRRIYGGRAFANALALRGFAVLVPDVFLWGSRRFELTDMAEQYRRPSSAAGTSEVNDYNQAAAEYEHVVAKYCTVLGASLAGVVNFEDRVAVAYLASRPDVDPAHVGCIGLSGGGLRAGLLQATSEAISACVVVCMMSTYEQLLDHNIATHTWMLFPPALPHVCDYPDLVACRAPSPLLVQYCTEDPLFTLQGMHDADRKLSEAYSSVGAPDGYTGRFYPGEHQFDVQMQDQAFDWLGTHLV